MKETNAKTKFQAKLHRPKKPGSDASWTFIFLPKKASEILPRRGRTTVEGTINGHPFQATLEPDGQLSHWLKIDSVLQQTAELVAGDIVTLEICPVQKEPEPEMPPDLEEALAAAPQARSTWDQTTTIARLDWIHWIASAKQAKTRTKRIGDACDMLASGKKRVCCFDPSGFYSNAFHAPETAE